MGSVAEDITALPQRQGNRSREELAERLERDGFVHLEAVIPPARVEEALALARDAGSQANFHETRVFAFLLEELQVHRLVQSLLDEPIYYPGWSGVMLEVKAAPGQLHDDAKGSPIPADGGTLPYFGANLRPYDPVKHPTFPLYRLFIYLNDHVKSSGGTKLRRGSHKRHELFTRKGFKALLRGRFGQLSLPFFGYENPMVKPGDAVLFNLRTRHAGHFVRLRGPLARLALPTRLDNLIKRLTLGSKPGRWLLRFFAQPFPEKRTSLVVDFCLDSDWARGFQANRLLYPGNVQYQAQFFDCNRPQFRARLERLGLRVLNSPALPAVERFLRGG